MKATAPHSFLQSLRLRVLLRVLVRTRYLARILALRMFGRALLITDAQDVHAHTAHAARAPFTHCLSYFRHSRHSPGLPYNCSRGRVHTHARAQRLPTPRTRHARVTPRYLRARFDDSVLASAGALDLPPAGVAGADEAEADADEAAL